MALKSIAFIASALTLSINANAVVIGSLSHEAGDVFVSDSLNNVEWMHFSEAGFDGNRSSLEAKFADSNSELFGFHIASASEAINFATAAFGVTPTLTLTGRQTFNSFNGVQFTEVMGDGYTGNTNNIWLHTSGNTGALAYSWINQGIVDTAYYHQYDTITDSWPDAMTYLAVRDVSAVPVPAAVWLFGSGLIGLIGIVRRKKA